MWWHVILFDILSLLASLYALGWGGAPERIATGLMAAALFATIQVGSPHGFLHIEVGLFLVDLALFAAFYGLSLVSTRFWPLWMSALQGLAVLSHAVEFAPPPTSFGYAVMEQFWAWPMVTLLVVATARHRRRLARNGIDPPWIAFAGRPGSRDRP